MYRIVVLICFISTIAIETLAFGESTDHTIAVTTTDFQFTPNSWTINPGKDVTLTITNTGVEEHEWVLLKQGTRITIPFGEDDEDKVYWEIEAGPNTTKKETFITPLKPGTYDIVCGKPQHIEQGMKATLIVK